ncbi:Hypothetical predicted protein [Cloeon dipterum]|uniref:Bee-milk protein n=1 Tax=Cloeon dipterum TaxID=197152 RepID=A0A8S1D4T5_9INSE|nr:Hypothetical predicted protein [Cloeon dipterum]
MEAEVKCTEADCTGKKECGDYCIICFILNEDPIEDSPRPDEGNSEKTGDMLAKNETLAAVSVAVDEPQVEHNARQVLRANKNVVFAKANGLPPEHPKIFEQEITSVGFSNFGVCPASEGISERQSVAVQDKITDSTVESAGSVSRIEPEPSTSGYSGQKRKRNANTDSVEAKKNSRANERKANASQDGKRLKEGVCQQQHTTRRAAARETRGLNTMSALFASIFLLGLVHANAVNFTTVYEWDQSDFIWPSGADTSIEQMKQNFNPENVDLRYMAVFGERLILSLDSHPSIPATLVWLPTSDTSTAPPQLAPFPSWDLHIKDNCETIQAAEGIETDNDGRLWVLDDGSRNCPSKLWIFDLAKNDTIERVHQFPDTVISHTYNERWFHDIVLDKTPDDYLAYIVDSKSEHIVVYSRNMDKSWSVRTPGSKWISLALSPNCEARQLFLGKDNSKEFYSMSVSELKKEGGNAAVKFIGEWDEEPYKMLIDSANVLYAAFHFTTYISKWNISEPFSEQRFHEVGKLRAYRAFTYALDANGTIWMTERNVTGDENNNYKLLQAEVGARSYQYSTSTASTTPQVNVNEETSEDVNKTSTSKSGTPQLALQLNETSGGYACLVGDPRKIQSSNTVVMFLLVCCLVLSGIVILWLTLRMRRMQNSFRQIQIETNGEMMARYIHIIFTLTIGLSLAADNFTSVFDWDHMSFDIVSAESKNFSFSGKFYPMYMAVSRERLFLSIFPPKAVPATLVSLPTTSATPPKLTPFPSEQMHIKDNCRTIQHATGLEADSEGRLWVLDNGNQNCLAKLWIFNLENNDALVLVHEFPQTLVSKDSNKRWMHDLVLDETKDDWLSYILELISGNLLAFSMKSNKSWLLQALGQQFSALALSPKEQNRRRLYLTNSNELYSVSVASLTAGSGDLEKIGSWTKKPYRMLTDSAGSIHAAFLSQKYASTWNFTDPLKEARFFEIKETKTIRPFVFSLDPAGTLWLMVNDLDQKHRLLKAEKGVRSYLYNAISEKTFREIFPLVRFFPIACLIILGVFLLGLSTAFISRLFLRRSKQEISLQEEESCSEPVPAAVPQERSISADEADLHYDYVTAEPPSPGLYQRAESFPSQSEIPRHAPSSPAEYDDVGIADQEVLYENYGLGPRNPEQYVEMRLDLESVVYLEVLADEDGIGFTK